MTMAPETPTVALRHGRDLVTPELFARLADFCAEEYGHERSMAERIMTEALAFVDVMGRTGEGMSPSAVVDPGWHTFMLHTEEYAEFCHTRYGRFIHHAPKSRYRDRATMADVVARMRAHGYKVDESLWGTKADCNEPTCCGDGPCC
ncbi:glycine-rich domain-containing protein [Streptomyces sp. NPDC055966]|uniref:glycine-rich domain-containing protein n=1 Tax=Streptomyces sp. NPDC055966 TaxID=3345669 RepID=UPI0035DF993C